MSISLGKDYMELAKTMTDKQIICKCNDKECGQCSFEEQLKAKEQECERLTLTLTEIKEIAEKDVVRGHMMSPAWLVQKISECEVEQWKTQKK